MSGYTDGFVIILSKDKVEDYRKMSDTAKGAWMDHGALNYVECVGEDLDTKEGCGSFLTGLPVGPDETVIFSWISYESRQHRDEVNAKAMQDPRLEGMCGSEGMPFDPKRMMYGGFKVIVSPSK
ncbi:MAG: DUF1428 domain-containing protein [Puniceicoccales bacterium]